MQDVGFYSGRKRKDFTGDLLLINPVVYMTKIFLAGCMHLLRLRIKNGKILHGDRWKDDEKDYLLSRCQDATMTN